MFTAPEGVSVLTTEEHCDYFRAAIGGDIDFHFNPIECLPLDIFLGNVAASRGKIVILDEAYFINMDVLLKGLQKFLDEPRNPTYKLQLIYVCPNRFPGDSVLYQLTAYFSIFDIVFGCPTYEIGYRALHLITNPNMRINISYLLPPLEKIAQIKANEASE